MFRSRKEAERYRTQVLAALDADQYIRAGSTTFNALCDRYLNACEDRIEATSIRWYKRTIDQHIRPEIGALKVSQIKPIHIQQVLENARDVSRATTKRGSPLGPSSKGNVLVTIRAVFAWAVRMELASRNPAPQIPLPKKTQRDYPHFDRETVRAILTAIQGTEFEAIAKFALMTGVRRGELAALRWQDLDLARGKYSIRRSAAILDGRQIYKSPKSLRSKRTDALPSSLIALLEEHRREQALRYDQIGLGLPTKDTLVSDRENVEAWNINELSRRWSRFIVRAGLPPIRWHDLRHGFASISKDAGESLHSISTALGHSSIGITSSTYVHVFDDTKRRRAERLDAYIAPAFRDTDVTNANSEGSETA